MGDTEEEGDITGLEILPGEARCSNHILGTRALGYDTRRMSPLSCFENQYGLLESGKKQRLLKNVCKVLLSPKQHRYSRLKTAWNSSLTDKTSPMCPSAHTGLLLYHLLF